MKNFVVIHILLAILLMLIYQCVGAQDYVLTARGDSLTGEVKPLFYGPEQKVRIQESGNKKTTLSLFEVRAFSHEGNVYHPVRAEERYVFMKLLQPGYLTLYAYQLENQTRFDGLFLKKSDGDNMVVPNLGFKKYLSRFLEDCPAVVSKIESGELGKKNLNELVATYNACVEGRTIDHDKVIAQQQKRTTEISAWDTLEEKVREKDFDEKQNALEMIAEIKNKVHDREKIPNFLLQGLKSSLADTGLTAEVESAIASLPR